MIPVFAVMQNLPMQNKPQIFNRQTSTLSNQFSEIMNLRKKQKSEIYHELHDSMHAPNEQRLKS